MKAVCSTILVLAVLSPAWSAPKAPPSLYRVNGKPVPASCLEDLANAEGKAPPINLAHCGNPKQKPKTQDDGTVGYEIPEGGYFYYHYLGKAGGIDVLSIQNSGGGSGHFTQLVGVQSDGHTVNEVQVYAAGDRCNGGIEDEKVANGMLMFDQAITPYDLIALADPKTKLEAYKDLEASAASCIGVSHMRGDGKHWTGVSLTESDWSDQKGWTEQYKYQACFNKLYREAVSTHQDELDRKGLAAFAAAFAERCIKR